MSAAKWIHLSAAKWIHLSAAKWIHLGAAKRIHLGAAKRIHLGAAKRIRLGAAKRIHPHRSLNDNYPRSATCTSPDLLGILIESTKFDGGVHEQGDC